MPKGNIPNEALFTDEAYAQNGQSSFETSEAKSLTDRINDFREVLGEVAEIRPDHNIVVNLDEPDPTDRAMLYFRQQEFIDSPHTPHRLYLNRSLGDAAIASYSTDIAFTPRRNRAGKYTAHGVFFVDLQMKADDGSVKELPVAVKPHEDEAGDANDTCLMEYVNTLAVAKLGIFTLEPVGLINGRNRAYSMTRLEEGITTLDSIDWSNFYPDIEKDPGMMNIWSQVARQTAMIHAMGDIMHGDLAARNIATTTDDTVFFLDWEMGNISRDKHPGSTTSWALAYQDLERLGESMCRPPDPKYGGGIGLFTKKDGDWWGGFKKIVFDEYCAYRLAFAEEKGDEKPTSHELAAIARDLKVRFAEYQDQYAA